MPGIAAGTAAPSDRRVASATDAGRAAQRDDAMLLFALLGFGALAQGGFYPTQSTILAVAALALAWAAGRGALGGTRSAGIAFAALAAGLTASTAANGFPSEAVRSFATLGVAAGVYAAVRGIAAARGPDPVIVAIARVGALASAAGLAGLVLHRHPLAAHEGGVWRAASTLTYANAAACLLALALPAALLAARARPGRLARLTIWAILAGLLATLSRGGAVAAAVAAVAFCALGGGRAALRPLIRPAIGAAVAFAGLIPSIVNDGARPLIGLAALAAGALVAGVDLGERAEARVRRAAALAVAATLLVVPAALLWSDAGRIVASRVGPGSGVRLVYWQAALDAADAPLLGSGPGTFRAERIVDGEMLSLEFAHNEWLQAWVETGAVGVLALAIAFGLLARAALRARPRAASGDRVVWAAAVAACAGFAAQSLLDFVWHVPVLVGVAFAWLAIATAAAPRQEGGAIERNP